MCMYEQSTNHISLKKIGLDVIQSHPTAQDTFRLIPGLISCVGWEMGTAIACIECSQMAGLIKKMVENLRKHRLFVQLFFVQLSFVQRLYVIVVTCYWCTSVRVRARAHTEVQEVLD